jgi:hypothetical protein
MEKTKQEIKFLLSENQDKLPLSSLYWDVVIADDDNNKTNFFEFVSLAHASNTVRPVGFHKPILILVEPK